MACLPACLSRALETHHPAVLLRGFELTWVPDVDTEDKRTSLPKSRTLTPDLEVFLTIPSLCILCPLSRQDQNR